MCFPRPKKGKPVYLQTSHDYFTTLKVFDGTTTTCVLDEADGLHGTTNDDSPTVAMLLSFSSILARMLDTSSNSCADCDSFTSRSLYELSHYTVCIFRDSLIIYQYLEDIPSSRTSATSKRSLRRGSSISARPNVIGENLTCWHNESLRLSNLDDKILGAI